MNEGEVRFVTRAYDWHGRLLDDMTIKAKEQSDLIYQENGDMTEFALEVIAKYHEGEYDSD